MKCIFEELNYLKGVTMKKLITIIGLLSISLTTFAAGSGMNLSCREIQRTTTEAKDGKSTTHIITFAKAYCTTEDIIDRMLFEVAKYPLQVSVEFTEHTAQITAVFGSLSEFGWREDELLPSK